MPRQVWIGVADVFPVFWGTSALGAMLFMGPGLLAGATTAVMHCWEATGSLFLGCVAGNRLDC